jgi:hypothetical protein
MRLVYAKSYSNQSVPWHQARQSQRQFPSDHLLQAEHFHLLWSSHSSESSLQLQVLVSSQHIFLQQDPLQPIALSVFALGLDSLLVGLMQQ